jgi:hypothetical protein
MQAWRGESSPPFVGDYWTVIQQVKDFSKKHIDTGVDKKIQVV